MQILFTTYDISNLIVKETQNFNFLSLFFVVVFLIFALLFYFYFLFFIFYWTRQKMNQLKS